MGVNTIPLETIQSLKVAVAFSNANSLRVGVKIKLWYFCISKELTSIPRT